MCLTAVVSVAKVWGGKSLLVCGSLGEWEDFNLRKPPFIGGFEEIPLFLSIDFVDLGRRAVVSPCRIFALVLS